MATENLELSSRLSKARHDLRNPLSDILGFAELLLEETAQSEISGVLEPLRAMHRDATGILDLLNRSLDPQTFDPSRQSDSSLNSEIARFCHSVRATIIDLIRQHSASHYSGVREDLGRISAAASKLEEVAPELLARVAQPIATAAGSGSREAASDSVLSPAAMPSSHLPPDGGARFAGSEGSNSGASFRQSGGSLLIVEDNEGNRALLARRLGRQGYGVSVAANGREALELLRAERFDLVLLDIMMPEVDGFEVLEQMKADPALRHIPVIMISALDDLQSLVRCIQKGADDYLTKPFDPVLLRARIGACLEKKRLRDQEQIYLRQLQAEQERSERLLLNVLPRPIAERLKQGEEPIVDAFQEVTVLFADLVGFTAMASHYQRSEVVQLLNDVFSSFDQLTERYGLEKIKTIGDCYMVVGGLPTPRPDHAIAVAEMALDMLERLGPIGQARGIPIQLRIGINSGSVIAGVIGKNKFIYDLWGDAVNTASRMESHGQPNCIQISEATYSRLRGRYAFQERGVIDVKGKGNMTTYFLCGRLESSPG